MVRLTHAHAVDTRPFLPRREGPGDEARHWSCVGIQTRQTNPNLHILMPGYIRNESITISPPVTSIVESELINIAVIIIK